MATTENDMMEPGSKLCDDCKLLIITDEAIESSGVIDEVVQPGPRNGPSLLFKRVPTLDKHPDWRFDNIGPSVSPSLPPRHEFYHRIPMQHRRFDTYPTFPAMSKSAEKGCPLCHLLLDEIQHKVRPPDIVMVYPSTDDLASNGYSDSASEISDDSPAIVDLEGLRLEQDANPNEEGHELDKDGAENDVLPAPPVVSSDVDIEIVPRPESPVATRWMDFDIGEEVQIDFDYFLKYYHHKLNLTRPSVRSFVQEDVTGLSRLTAKVSKKDTNELRYRSGFKGDDEDPFMFGETHVSLAVEVNHKWTSVGEYLQIFDIPIDPDPMSLRNIDSLCGELQSCIASHAKCRQDTSPNPDRNIIPTRLLSVGSSDIQDNGICLVAPAETDLPPQSFRYTTLSYCWGSAPPLKAERQTIETWKTCIPFDILPEVFQDAIKTTRHLDIPYLWIDSMCIVQDDPDDWLRESARMADIYRNSVVTIAAASSDSAQEGFRHRRPGPYYIWPQVSMPFQSTRYPQVHGHYLLRRENPHPINPLHDIQASRWNTRGWVFQEQHLSRRLAVFGPSMLQFHCREWSLRENCLVLFQRFLADAPSFSRHNESACSHAHTNKYEVWYELMEQYSSRHLTSFTDRLPSIAGIAREMHACLKGLGIEHDEYAAGLWKGDLHRGLLWRVPSQSQAAEIHVADNTQPQPYVAPTWSWASRNGPVALTSLPDSASYMCEIADCEMQTVFDAYGPLKDGRITIKAHYLSHFASFGDEKLKGLCSGLDHTGTEKMCSVERYTVGDKERVITMPLPSKGEGIYLDERNERGVTEAERNGFWVLPMVAQRNLGNMRQHFGLVLLPRCGDENEYVRIGMFASREMELGEGEAFFVPPMWEERTIILV